MSDRFFPNVMPDFTEETTEQKNETTGDSLLGLLSMSYPSLSQRFKRAALDLKETVTPLSFFFVLYYWVLFGCRLTVCGIVLFCFQVVIETWGLTGQHVRDFSLYSGALGTAFLLFKAYHVDKNQNDLGLCLEIVKACDSSSSASRYSFHL